MDRPLNMLVLASYFKGERFMRQAHARGAKLYLLTQQRYLEKPWPREVLVDVLAQANEPQLQSTVNTVSYLMRKIHFDRIVPMDDYDVETAASLREHLRIPGMGDTTARHFRDKLATRVKAKEEGIRVPEFTPVFNDDAVREWTSRVPAPWMLKPRSEASATGITKVESVEQLWQVLEEKGDRRSYFLLEKYVPGDVYHVDSVVSERKVIFMEAHKCGSPPFNVAHGGGVFSTRTLPRGDAETKALKEMNAEILAKLNLVRGVSHTEYIKGREDGQFYLLETSARVGGAYIANTVEAATGLNLWTEWANIEMDHAEGKSYALPALKEEYAGLTLTLARQETPDTSAYDDPEVVFRVPEKSHAGLVVQSKDPERVRALTEAYAERFQRDFTTFMPPAKKPGH